MLNAQEGIQKPLQIFPRSYPSTRRTFLPGAWLCGAPVPLRAWTPRPAPRSRVSCPCRSLRQVRTGPEAGRSTPGPLPFPHYSLHSRPSGSFLGGSPSASPLTQTLPIAQAQPGRGPPCGDSMGLPFSTPAVLTISFTNPHPTHSCLYGTFV